jgi:ankyrin repeat protein
VIEILLGSGADINLKDSSGYTPLFYAVLNKNFKLVKLLVEHGANIDVCDNEGRFLMSIENTDTTKQIKRYLKGQYHFEEPIKEPDCN